MYMSDHQSTLTRSRSLIPSSPWNNPTISPNPMFPALQIPTPNIRFGIADIRAMELPNAGGKRGEQDRSAAVANNISIRANRSFSDIQ